MKNIFKYPLVTLAILLIAACTATSPASKSANAASKQNADGLRENLNNVTSSVDGAREDVQKASDAVNANKPEEAKAPLDSADAKLLNARKEADAAKARVSALESDVKSANQRADEWAAKASASDERATKETSKRKAAEDKYDNAWLGGRSWNVIYWIIAILVLLMILDVTTNIPVNPLLALINVYKIIAKFITSIFSKFNT